MKLFYCVILIVLLVQEKLNCDPVPSEYLYSFQSLNDHTIQSRMGLQPIPRQQTQRFIHPTRIFPSPQNQLKIVNNSQLQPRLPKTQHEIKSAPASIIPKPNFSSNFKMKSENQALPDIHKNNQFVAPNIRAIKPKFSTVSIFNSQQALPIQKKSLDESPTVIFAPKIFSIKTAPIAKFYETIEFDDLLREYGIKVDIKKLPAITDVMAILGTNNAEETLKGIREVINTKDGKEIISSFLDHSFDRVEDDEFYEYDEDARVGEINVGEYIGSPHIVKTMQFQQPVPSVEAIRASSSGTLTGTEQSSWMWNPISWFRNLGLSTKIESSKTDSEILKKAVGQDNVLDSMKYIGRFLKPVSKESISIRPIFKNSNTELPPIKLTEEQFQDMIYKLKLVPIAQQVSNIEHKTMPILNFTAPKPAPTIAPSTLENITFKKFSEPIIVQNSHNISQRSDDISSPSHLQVSDDKDLKNPEETLALPQIKRNFIPISEPQRSAPYDFTATGIVHRINPEEVLKYSRSLSEVSNDETE